MPLLRQFLGSASVSLKVCGVTCLEDARLLTKMGVDALGVNFWPGSRRFVDPGACEWLAEVAGGILRVGVFVDAGEELPLRLFRDGLIDLAQLHGEESPGQVLALRGRGVPVLKSLGVGPSGLVADPGLFPADGLLLDVHAPGEYGGTGRVFDWEVLRMFRRDHPETPVVLAGGIGPGNAAAAAAFGPAALDVASGAESSPGVKDPAKVAMILGALREGQR